MTTKERRATISWRHAVAGVSSALVLFASAHAAAGFFTGVSDPMVALGSTIIDFTPSWLKDFAIEVFGTNDKVFLFVVLFIVTAALAVVVGLVAKRSSSIAISMVVVLSVVLGAAVLTRSATELTDLIPTILGTGLGVLALRVLTALANKAESTHDSADQKITTSRRRFLFGATGTVLVGLAATGVTQAVRGARDAIEATRKALGLPAAKSKVPALPNGADLKVPGVSPFVTPNPDFYRIDTALSVPRIQPQDWYLRVHGLVENEFTLSFDELASEDLVEHYLTLTCVSNPVGGDLIGNAKWLGFPVRELMKRAVPLPGADMVLSTSIDGFSASTPLEFLTDNRAALLAIGMNDEPLPLEHGFPVRMVVPGLYGYVSATKWVVDLEVTRFQDKTAYWTTRGWSERGPIKMSSRIETPRSFASVAGSRVIFGGTAWSQTVGISKVEIRIDKGDWQEAELSILVTDDTWRQWRYEWSDASPGNHSATVRATNSEGEIQSESIAPPAPDGASGWHRLQFSVA